MKMDAHNPLVGRCKLTDGDYPEDKLDHADSSDHEPKSQHEE